MFVCVEPKNAHRSTGNVCIYTLFSDAKTCTIIVVIIIIVNTCDDDDDDDLDELADTNIYAFDPERTQFSSCNRIRITYDDDRRTDNRTYDTLRSSDDDGAS